MRYRVCGRNRFLGYDPGEEFIADLQYEHEERAIARGSIEILGDAGVDLDDEQATLPPGWEKPATVRKTTSRKTKGD